MAKDYTLLVRVRCSVAGCYAAAREWVDAEPSVIEAQRQALRQLRARGWQTGGPEGRGSGDRCPDHPFEPSVRV